MAAAKSDSDFAQPVPKTTAILLSFPARHVLLLTLNRPKAYNAVTQTMEEEIGRVMDWFDDESSFRVVVITGAGPAFCTGGEIKSVVKRILAGTQPNSSMFYGTTPHGFGALSRRSKTTKPIIAAVNGKTYGGGLEMVLNCDIVVASEQAVFGAIETSRGMMAIHGALPRASRIAGHQFASEAYLMARTLSAKEAHEKYRFVNRVVPHENLLPTALEIAQDIARSPPKAIMAMKELLLLCNKFVDGGSGGRHAPGTSQQDLTAKQRLALSKL
ncbi:ClpP crotonase [Cytidiella melzeri]|nr:ClpP crotonase [Cytidiella melzeri]